MDASTCPTGVLPALDAPSASCGARMSGTSTDDAVLRIMRPRNDTISLSARCRDLVDAGVPDQPAEVWVDGSLHMLVRSIHRVALKAVVENPSLHWADWSPHPNVTVGPRVRAMLDVRETDRVLRKEYGA